MLWKLFIYFSLLLVTFFLINNKFFSSFISFWKHHPVTNIFNGHSEILSPSIQDSFEDYFSSKTTSDCSNIGDIAKIRNDLSRLFDVISVESKNNGPGGIHQYFKSDHGTNDFAYVTIIPASYDVDPIVNETAAAWCQSIRTIHSARSNFDIVALFPSQSIKFHPEKFKCFDKLLFVNKTLSAYMQSARDSVDISVISKAWLFSLVQYKRIIYLKHNLAPVRSNIYNYFFKDYYLAEGDTKIAYHTTIPKKLYTQSSVLSPINSNFMSLEPSIDTAIELLSIYAIGKWDVNNGWMCYGAFDFDPVSHMESFEDLNEPAMQYQLHRKADVHPWHQSNWLFDSTWSDTGLLFYYHYLQNPKTSGIIYELDFDHSLIEYVSRVLDSSYMKW